MNGNSFTGRRQIKVIHSAPPVDSRYTASAVRFEKKQTLNQFRI